MERGGDRSAEERRAAAEARARVRSGEVPQGEAEERSGGWSERSDRGMSRYYGGDDVYARRRLFALAGGLGVILLLILLLFGC